MRRLSACLLLVLGMTLAACGGGGSDNTSGADAGGSGTSTTADGTSHLGGITGATVKGSVTLGGAYTGTYTWNSDLAVNQCYTNNVGVTLTDGSEFISLTVGTTDAPNGFSVAGNGVGMGSYTATSGAKLDMKASGLHVSGSATVDGTAKEARGQAGDVSVKGKLDLDCP